MQVKRLEFTAVGSLEDFYRQLAAQAELPGHFGRNLDALFDVLSADLAGPLQIVWHRHDEARSRLGEAHYGALLAVLEDAASSRGDIELVLD